MYHLAVFLYYVSYNLFRNTDITRTDCSKYRALIVKISGLFVRMHALYSTTRVSARISHKSAIKGLYLVLCVLRSNACKVVPYFKLSSKLYRAIIHVHLMILGRIRGVGMFYILSSTYAKGILCRNIENVLHLGSVGEPICDLFPAPLFAFFIP